jgi:succinate-acetate transporter protein
MSTEQEPVRPEADRPVDGRNEPAWTLAGPVMSDQDLRSLRATGVTPAGEPGAMGFYALAISTFLLGLPFSGLIGIAYLRSVIPVVLIVGGLAQFAVGVVSYRKGNTPWATMFCFFGANYAGLAFWMLFAVAGVTTQDKVDTRILGIHLFCIAAVSLMLTVAALPMSHTEALFLGMLTLGFLLVALRLVGGLGNVDSAWRFVGEVGGYLMWLAGAVAFYLGSALVVNTSYQREVMPIFERLG